MSILIRNAALDDMRRVWEWANDPDTRKASFTSDPIPWEGHVGWYERSLASGDRVLLIAEVDGVPIGLLRFDRHTDREGWERASVGINLAPEQRGKGFGTTLLTEGIERARTLGIGTIVAEIRPDNVGSVRAFQKAGYAFQDATGYAGQEAVRYVYVFADP